MSSLGRSGACRRRNGAARSYVLLTAFLATTHSFLPTAPQLQQSVQGRSLRQVRSYFFFSLSPIRPSPAMHLHLGEREHDAGVTHFRSTHYIKNC